ncbi:MAG: hypothetical protein IPO99_12270 [Nitrospira sp.]|nr:hypothetical protein [Nitrospira sp.]
MMAQPRAAAKSQDAVNEDEQEEKAPDTKLYEELGELARFIDTTMKTLSGVQRARQRFHGAAAASVNASHEPQNADGAGDAQSHA